jgi:hypothetical protein
MKTQNKLFLIIAIIIIFQITSKNPYRILNVPAYATFKEIKSSYRKLSLLHHPDKHRNDKNADEIKRKMIEINEAYDTIKEKRSLNDADEDDNYLLSLIVESFFIIIAIIIYYKLQLIVFKFLVWILEVSSYFIIWTFTIFHLTDRFFSHHFEDESNQYIVCFILSVIVSVFFSWLYPKKKTSPKEEKKVREDVEDVEELEEKEEGNQVREDKEENLVREDVEEVEEKEEGNQVREEREENLVREEREENLVKEESEEKKEKEETIESKKVIEKNEVKKKIE